jgi:hypothetical protein
MKEMDPMQANIPGGVGFQGSDLRLQRADVLRSVTRLSIIGLIVLLAFYAVVRSVSPDFPIVPLFIASLFELSILFVTLYLLRMRKVSFAIGLFFVGALIGLTLAVFFLGGLTGPLMPGYWALLLFAGFIGGRQTVERLLIPILCIAAGFAAVESLGLLPPVGLSGPALRFLHLGIFTLVSMITAMILVRFQRANQQSLNALEDRRMELAQAIMDAEAAQRAEAKAREQEAAIGRQLRHRIDEYVSFLQAIVAGDHNATLDLPEETENETSQQLLTLGRYLEQTVEALVEALEEAQLTQRLYVRQSWEDLRDARHTPTGYRYRDREVEVDETAWLPLMDAASSQHEMILGEGARSLAIPLSIRDEVIGVLGLERDQGSTSGWHREDLALIQDVIDQLAQTIDRLRLLDDISRSATLEQTIGEVTSHIRAEVEIESVIERTLTELADALGAEQGAIQLSFERREEIA